MLQPTAMQPFLSLSLSLSLCVCVCVCVCFTHVQHTCVKLHIYPPDVATIVGIFDVVNYGLKHLFRSAGISGIQHLHTRMEVRV